MKVKFLSKQPRQLWIGQFLMHLCGSKPVSLSSRVLKPQNSYQAFYELTQRLCNEDLILREQSVPQLGLR